MERDNVEDCLSRNCGIKDGLVLYDTWGKQEMHAEFDRKMRLGRVRLMEVVLVWLSEKEFEVL